jgi:hypothetical protein
MLFTDKFSRRVGKERLLSENCDRVDVEFIESRKIIDFESAKQAFERENSTPQQGEQFRRTFFSDTTIDRSADLAESIVTVVLVLVLGLSLLLGMIWGF